MLNIHTVLMIQPGFKCTQYNDASIIEWVIGISHYHSLFQVGLGDSSNITIDSEETITIAISY